MTAKTWVRFGAALLVTSGCEPAAVDAQPDPLDSTSQSPPVRPTVACAAGEVARIGAASYATLQQALDVVAAGETVTICSGVHLTAGNEYAGAGPIRIAGETGDPRDVVLDGQYSGGILRMSTGSVEVQIDGLTFLHGGSPGSSDQTIDFVPGWGEARLRRLIVSDSVGTGGVVTAYGARVVVEDCLFEGYQGPGGFTFPEYLAIWFGTEQFVVRRSSFRDIHAISALIGGGNAGAYSGARMVLEDIHVEDVDGHWAFFDLGTTYDMRVDISDVEVRDSGTNTGAAANFSGSGRIYGSMRRASFTDIDADQVSALDLGGTLQAGFFEIEDSVFRRNTHSRRVPAPAAAIGLNDPWVLTLNNVDFGLGAHRNEQVDIMYCLAPRHLGPNVSGVVDTRINDACP